MMQTCGDLHHRGGGTDIPRATVRLHFDVVLIPDAFAFGC
jgi:hypothetical protein